ncbi:MAG: TonB-dependent receptor domain-containing protein [Panacagrimonas sp.]
MKLMFKTLLLACVLCLGPTAYAAEMNLNSFLGASPLKDLDVELDGKVVGVTGAQGELSTDLTGGAHTVRLMKNAVPLAEFSFEVAEGESADLSIAFTDFEKKPDITFDKYDAAAAVGGAPGVVEGYIVDAEGYALPGATVRAEEAGIEAVSNDDGAFRLEIPRGTYTLKVSHPEHETATQTGLKIRSNLGVATQVALRPKVAEFGGEVDGAEGAAETGSAAVEGETPAQPDAQPTITTGADGVQEITVIGTYRPAEKSAATIERFSVSVTDAISVDELLRFGDGDVAASLKRLVGVSVSEGKYAVVRGLDGRYISATLNGALMPSTDPFRRDVQLDLFPPDILGGIEIQKNFSADLPGDTTGGIIKLATRGMPEEYVNSLSFSVAFVDQVTGEDLSTYEGGDSDFLGFDDGLRDLPGAVRSATSGGSDFTICEVADQTGCIPLAQAVALAGQLPNIYNPKSEKANPNFGLSYTLGNVFERDYGDIGLYGTVSYDNESKSRQDAVINDPTTASTYARDVRETSLNSYFVAGLKTEADMQILSKTMLLRSTEDTVEIESGILKDDNLPFDSVLLEWVERQFLAQQFQGTHFFFDAEHKLDWRVGLSQTTRDSPDRRSYDYLSGSLAISTVERSYSELTEDGLDLGVDYVLPFQPSETIKTEVTVGALANARERDVELVRIGVRQGSNPIQLNQDLESLLTADNFASDAFRLNLSSTTNTDSYNAEQESMAAYISTKTDFGDAVTIVAGLRRDEFSQDLSFPNDGGNTAGLDSNEALPSVFATYRFTEDLQFRLGYAGTVSRPNITELAPSRFYDENGREYIGCPTCEASTIDNFDFRVEYYFNEKDSASLALFSKDIDKPLERSIPDGSGSATDALTFRNNESAKLSGIEIDLSKTFIDTAEHLLSVGANMAFIQSEIELDETGQRLEIDPKRDLQGQSPFLANLQVSYDHNPWSQKVTLLANYFDDRIDIVTRNQPAIMETGRLQLNLGYEKELTSASKLSLKLKNLLDEDTEYTQGGTIIETYKQGREISLGYSLKFN